MTNDTPPLRDLAPGEFQVFLGFLYVGLTAFGGPVAHRARFRELLVADNYADARRSDLIGRLQLPPQLFEDLWVFANLLPGPSSSQVAMAIGRIHAGATGALAAWAGFTLPTALLATAGGYLVLEYRQTLPPGLIAGLLLAVFVVILNAVRTMLLDHQKQLAPLLCAILAAPIRHPRGRNAGRAWVRYLREDGSHAVLAAVAGTIIVLAMNENSVLVAAFSSTIEVVSAAPVPDWARQNLLQVFQVGVILMGLGAGLLFFPGTHDPAPAGRQTGRNESSGFVWLVLFFLLLGATALSWSLDHDRWLADLAARFYRVGALVFGGGHVVLPLLEVEVVATGLVEREVFLIGYGAIQALPGPLFAFAAFLGTVATPSAGIAPGGWQAGLLAVAAIFAPSLLLVSGLLGVFLRHRDQQWVRKALNGANAAVVGILGAALWPIWTAASGKWHALGLGQPAFWFASLVLLGLLAGIPLRGTVAPPRPGLRHSWPDRLKGLFLQGRTDTAGRQRRLVRIPAPLVVAVAALGGWALSG